MSERILITGGSGLVGGEVARRCVEAGRTPRVLVRSSSETTFLRELGVELVEGSLTDPKSLGDACDGVTHVVHCAAKVGDWGPVEEYRAVNVDGTLALCEAAARSGTLERFVHVSSLGVYEARDHHGTDETTPPKVSGIDGYTLSKAESEQAVLGLFADRGFPAVVLRPGFVYGPADQTVLPRIIERLRDGKFAFLGSGDQLMNNVAAANVGEAVMKAVDADDSLIGEVFNVTDHRLVTKQEFVFAVADGMGLPRPTKHVPLPVARAVAKVLETVWRWRGKTEAPLLSQARIKFLGLNLDFSSRKANEVLGYRPPVDFAAAMSETMEAQKRRLGKQE